MSGLQRMAYGPSEVAELLGCSRAWVYLRLDDGTIPSVKLGGRRLIRHEDVEVLLTITSDRNEAFYRDELAAELGARVEVHLGLVGRADLVCERYGVFEVEPASRWRHGLRQVLAYSAGSKLPANLAVYGCYGASAEQMYLKLRKADVDTALWLRSKSARWRRVTSRAEAKLTN